MLYAVSVLLALLFLLPELAYRQGFEFPLLGMLSVPAAGLGYMCVFFHELGHTVTYWLFGYPAMPTFDFQYGGGMTYGLEQSKKLVWCLYGLAAVGLYAFYKKGHYRLLAGLAVVTALHAAIAFNLGHEALILYMGHGGEILVGCFCILRGCIGHSEYGEAEKWLNMIFGVYILAHNALMSWTLMTDEFSRADYEGQKGGHGFGDFSRVAEIFGTKLEIVAGGSLAIMAVLLALTFLVVWHEKRLD